MYEPIKAGFAQGANSAPQSGAEPGAPGSLRTVTRGALDEALADLKEISFHIDELRAGLQPNATSQWQRKLEDQLAALEKTHHRHLDLLERSLRWGRIYSLSTESTNNQSDIGHNQFQTLLNNCRRDYLKIKAGLRVLWRQRGLRHCESDWQSPIYASTLNDYQNRLSDGIKEHFLDYKRDGHLDSRTYEKSFVAEYCSHLGTPLEAYLANSGMAAFTTVLHFLAHEMKLANCLAIEPMYFENLHLAGCYFPDLKRSKYVDPELLQSIRPEVVIVDAVTNCGEVLRHDLEALISWATAAKHNIALVIDSTCLPALLLPAGLLADLPANIRIFLVESLAKHHQLGMDTVTGGIVMAHAAQEILENFAKTRARAGTNISDASVYSLPSPRKAMLRKRLKRHSNNSRKLAEMLSRAGGAIASVSCLKGHSDFYGTCLTLHFQDAYRSKACYQRFESIAIELAQRKNHPLALSTSFGFDVSRLYVTAPGTQFEEPFLRIAVGTETTSQIETLAEILQEASALLKQTQGQQIIDKHPSTVRLSAVRRINANSQGAFIGEDALKRYLCPEHFAPSPLVELPDDLNPLRADGVRLTAKMTPLVPLMNIKSVPAYSMLAGAHERGDLAGVGHLIESSSSNTVLSLSVLGKLFGIESTSAIVDHSIAPSLVRMLQLFGIDILLHPGPDHPLYDQVEPRSRRAAALGDRPGWFNPGQYGNPDNPDGFERWLAPEIWTQTGGRIDLLVCALGTCGTMVGVSRGLKRRNPDLLVAACCPRRGEAVPGPRERAQLSDVAFAWQKCADILEMDAGESFQASISLLRRGIMAGPSSGMNYAGALQYLNQMKASGELEKFTSEHGELWCTFLCCDSPLPHVDEYFAALGPDYFPQAKNYEL